ncbi:MAG: valine--tRNA ligase [Candidatus Peribacteraceae bacterium]|nr:valine--tRNA ligase [Candidatus Peribacteraceae bacterium]
MTLSKAYDPQACEDRIYSLWEGSGAFKADAASAKEAFTVSMPPPNATGQLHLGHAVMLALEDIFIRFARMSGKEALWLPGTDHAAIATESVVIKKIQKEEKIADPRATYGRVKLVEKIAQFVEASRGTIRSQVRKMGSSCDWSRERYTLDPSLNRCVNEVFKKMYSDGLIYRGQRIVNWDPKMQTTVSDDEIEYMEEKVPYYTFQYGPFQISTARPETKFGDKYVVMHPDDERYKKYKDGDTFECEWITGKITATVIKDDKVIDPAFGTGCMTITPWHDMADFDLAERRDLPREQIIGFDGRLLPIAGKFAGMSIEEARPKVVEKLRAKGLLVKVDENYTHRVAVSYRGKGIVEPQIKEQWFINVNKQVVKWKKKQLSLKEVMQDVIRSRDIAIIPERFEKVYFHWIDNLRDWCISRQIWWGHRIPVWYKTSAKGTDMHVGALPPDGTGWTQDPDTLDTWFSSGLWTWSTLIDPALAGDMKLSLQDLLEKSPDFRKFHPTAVMETGYDILFFWVARMILMTTYATGQIPFKTVYLHGLVRTREGKKMSKSDPSTCIDPLEIIPKYGADALRLSMIVGQTPGNDFRLYEEKIAGYRNFINKLWNASRFVLMQCEQAKIDPSSIAALPDLATLSLADRAALHASEILIEDVTQGLAAYRLSEVGERLYSFVWDFFCDWYLELSKGNANHAVLVHILRRILKLLHPYCPFVTEELWTSLKPTGAGLLISEEWPKVKVERKDPKAQQEFSIVVEIIRAIRSMRVEYGISPNTKIIAYLFSDDHLPLLKSQQEHIERLAQLFGLMFKKPIEDEGVASTFLKGAEVHIALEGALDLKKLRNDLQTELLNLRKFLEIVNAKLGNPKFMEHAKKEVIELEQQKLASAEEKLKKIEERLKAL